MNYSQLKSSFVGGENGSGGKWDLCSFSLNECQSSSSNFFFLFLLPTHQLSEDDDFPHGKFCNFLRLTTSFECQSRWKRQETIKKKREKDIIKTVKWIIFSQWKIVIFYCYHSAVARHFLDFIFSLAVKVWNGDEDFKAKKSMITFAFEMFHNQSESTDRETSWIFQSQLMVSKFNGIDRKLWFSRTLNRALSRVSSSQSSPFQYSSVYSYFISTTQP